MKRTAALLTAGSILALAGCSSNAHRAEPAPDPTAAVLKAAQDYQSAANRGDWHTACTLSSARLRAGTIADCTAAHTAPPGPTAAGTASPSPAIAPPTYADGSTPGPITPASPSGTGRASDGPVSATDVLAVPAAGLHPAGYGVFLSFTVTWPGKPPTTDHRALRLVPEAGGWLVDQHEDAIQRADQLRAVLGGK